MLSVFFRFPSEDNALGVDSSHRDKNQCLTLVVFGLTIYLLLKYYIIISLHFFIDYTLIIGYLLIFTDHI